MTFQLIYIYRLCDSRQLEEHATVLPAAVFIIPIFLS